MAWKFVKHTTSKRRRSYGWEQHFDGLGRPVWLTINFGRHSWRWLFEHPPVPFQRRYGTTAKDNEAVKGWFFYGPDNRAPLELGRVGVPRLSSEQPLSAAEIRERNRAAVASGRFKPLPLIVVDPKTGSFE